MVEAALERSGQAAIASDATKAIATAVAGRQKRGFRCMASVIREDRIQAGNAVRNRRVTTRRASGRGFLR
jgi:hypothetical protein